MQRIIVKIILYCSIVFLIILLWTVTWGQKVDIDFRDSNIHSQFYSILFMGTPIAILLTLFGSVKKPYSRKRKILTIIATGLLSIFSFIYIMGSMFTIGFGAWSTENIAYERKGNPSIQIREQQYDIGALGYGRRRVVEVKPFLLLFWKTNPVDTVAIDKSQWIRIDKDGDVKSP
jgi:hypothetical protein